MGRIIKASQIRECAMIKSTEDLVGMTCNEIFHRMNSEGVRVKHSRFFFLVRRMREHTMLRHWVYRGNGTWEWDGFVNRHYELDH